MDVADFADEVLNSAAKTGCFARIELVIEGPIAKGRGIVDADVFVGFYFNQRTGTTAFALIQADQRVWGIDCDGQHGWHEHPLGRHVDHVSCAPRSPREIIDQIAKLVADRSRLDR